MFDWNQTTLPKAVVVKYGRCMNVSEKKGKLNWGHEEFLPIVPLAVLIWRKISLWGLNNGQNELLRCDIFSGAELTSISGNNQKEKENQQCGWIKCSSWTSWSHYKSVWLHGVRSGGRGWQGLRLKQEECRYHSSNYCFINGPYVAVSEQLHHSVLTARSLARHSCFCPQSVGFNLAQKLII